MEERQKKFLFGAIAVGVVGAGVLWARSASAKGLTGEPYVLEMFKTKTYRVVSIPPDQSVVEPVYSGTGPTLMEWAISEQKKGQLILVPVGYYAGTMSVSPSQILSVDQRLGGFIVQSGLFKVLPSQVQKPKTSTGAMGEPEFPWAKVALGVAALGVVGGGAYYLKARSDEQAAAPVSETDRIAEDYLRRLRAAGSY